MTWTQKYSKQAFYLIRQFLQDHHLPLTLEVLELERAEQGIELGTVVVPQKPLEAILEDYEIRQMQADMNQIQIKK